MEPSAVTLPSLGILILNRNGKEWLVPLYESLRACRYPNLRIYLVDNASSDGSIEATREGYPDVTVLRLPENLGYCMAYNLAMPCAFADGCEWVVWANNDILLEPDCLSELVRACRSDPRIAIAGPAFLAWTGDEPNYYMAGNHPGAVPAMRARSPQPIDVDWVEGSFLMVRKSCVETIGLLDPFLFAYWEEADFCRRARRRNYRVVLVPSARARHYGAGTSADKKYRSLMNRLQRRNYYVYKLANPDQAFARNLGDALFLWLVNLKALLPSSPASCLEDLLAFGRVVVGMRTVFRKYRADRSDRHPPAVTGQYSGVRIEVYGPAQ